LRDFFWLTSGDCGVPTDTLSVLIGFRDASGSVIPSILLHASHNLVDQRYLQPMSTNSRVPYLAGEQGIITLIVIVVIVVVVVVKWRKKTT